MTTLQAVFFGIAFGASSAVARLVLLAIHRAWQQRQLRLAVAKAQADLKSAIDSLFKRQEACDCPICTARRAQGTPKTARPS